MPTFKCSSCGQLYTVPAQMEGQLVNCRKCKQPVQIPFQNNQAHHPSPPKTSEESNGRLCFWLGLLFSLIGLIIAAIIGKTKGVKNALIGMAIGTGLCIASIVIWPIIVVNSIGNKASETRINTTRATKAAIGTAIQAYEVRMNRYPENLDELTVSTESMPAILDKSRLIDSWGVPFRYKKTGKYSFEICSAGPDGEFDTGDDIIDR